MRICVTQLSTLFKIGMEQTSTKNIQQIILILHDGKKIPKREEKSKKMETSHVSVIKEIFFVTLKKYTIMSGQVDASFGTFSSHF